MEYLPSNLCVAELVWYEVWSQLWKTALHHCHLFSVLFVCYLNMWSEWRAVSLIDAGMTDEVDDGFPPHASQKLLCLTQLNRTSSHS